jgi:hypothetical protein
MKPMLSATDPRATLINMSKRVDRDGLIDEGDLSLAAMGQPVVFQAQGA